MQDNLPHPLLHRDVMKVPNRLLTVTFTAALLALPLVVHAQTLTIHPALVTSSDPIERALAENKGNASTSIEGAGAELMLSYRSDQPIEVYMVPLAADNRFVPTDFITFTLPSTEAGAVKIDLTVSPGWTPNNTKWLMHLLTKDEEANAGFVRMEFVHSSPLTIVSAAVRHLMTSEPYTPSSYHALRGYRIMSVGVAEILGILLIVLSIIAFIVTKNGWRLQAMLVVMLTCFALYQVRFGFDLLRFSSEHLSGYAAGLNDEAGSVSQIAGVLNGMQNKKDLTVYVCRDGTNYKEKLLRYFVYPMRVSSEAADVTDADIALVMDDRDWSLETTTLGKVTTQVLKCNGLSATAQRVTTFPDGSVLFTLSR